MLEQQEQDPQAMIQAIKAQSYDIVTGLTAELAAVKQQVANMDQVLKTIVGIVSPGAENLTVNDLVSKLEATFITKKDEDDGEVTE